jgi:hippurate hydrolase
MGRSTWLLMGAGCALLPIPTAAQDDLDAAVDREIPSLVAIYKTIHAAPELSHYEERTAALAADELRRLGCTVVEHLGRFERPEWRGHGVAAVLRNGEGKVVLIRAELDALPIEEKTGLPYASKVKVRAGDGRQVGVMHACGHDAHLTCMLGLARVLVRLKDRWRGTVVLVGEPAEETLDGVKALLRDDLYRKVPKPDFVYGVHTIGDLEAGQVGHVSEHALAAATVVELTIRGVGSHASRPHEGKDPVVITAQVILALQTLVSRETSPLDPAVITVGTIHGGTKVNIIPDEVRLQISVRSYKEEVQRRLLKSIERVARGIAEAAGVPEDRMPIVEVSETESVAAAYNDPSLTERLVGALRRSLGRDRVRKMVPRMAGDDIGYFGLARQIPMCLLFVGAADPVKTGEGIQAGRARAAAHSPHYAPPPELTISTGVKVLAAGVIELLDGRDARRK